MIGWDYGLQYRGLSFFSPCSDGSLNIAARHPRWSLTWTWIVNVKSQRSRGWRSGFKFHRWRSGSEKWLLDLLWVVTISYSSQAAMPIANSIAGVETADTGDGGMRPMAGNDLDSSVFDGGAQNPSAPSVDRLLACRDCRYISPTFARCTHPKSARAVVDFVTGKETFQHPSCDIARTIGDCKRKALLFEPRAASSPIVG